jgi:hypothetical protein
MGIMNRDVLFKRHLGTYSVGCPGLPHPTPCSGSQPRAATRLPESWPPTGKIWYFIPSNTALHNNEVFIQKHGVDGGARLALNCKRRATMPHHIIFLLHNRKILLYFMENQLICNISCFVCHVFPISLESFQEVTLFCLKQSKIMFLNNDAFFRRMDASL